MAFLFYFARKTKVNFFVSVLLAYFILYFTLNFFFDYFFELLKRKNYYFIYTLLEYLTFAFILAYIISQKKFSNIVIALSLLFVAFLVIYFSTSKIRTVDSIPIGVESIIVFGYIFYFFYQYFKRVDGTHIYNDAGFWFVAGIFIYLGSTFFFNILGNVVTKQQIKSYWYLTFIGDILKNILFTVAILVYAKSPIEKKHSGKTNTPYLDMI